MLMFFQDLAVCKNRCPKGREMAAKMGLASGSGLGQKKDRTELITDSYGQKGKLGLGEFLLHHDIFYSTQRKSKILSLKRNIRT